MEPTIPHAMLATLLGHATAAARLVGHLDGPVAEPLSDHIDAIVHGLTELLGDPHRRSAAGAVAAIEATVSAVRSAPDDRVAYDGAPVLAISAGGAP
jgi:hypothetical protein